MSDLLDREGRRRRPSGTAPAHRPAPARPRPAPRPRPPAQRPRTAGATRSRSEPPAGRPATLGATVWAQLEAALRRARSGRRVAAVLVVWLVLMVALGWRLVIVQVVSADEYRESATRQTARELTVPAVRGRLLDRDGNPLALSVTAATVIANPRLIAQSGQDVGALATRLAELIGSSDVEAVRERLTGDVGFEYVARQVPHEVGAAIADADPALPGISVLDEPLRTYPGGTLAGTLLGFAGRDNVGLSGLEAEYEELLAGEPGLLEMERAPGGVEIAAAPRVAVPAVPGTDVALTIDRAIQGRAEAALADAVERTQADGAAAVVLDADSGAVLAMASAPALREDGIHDRNRVVADAYEPGSVQKVVTIAAGIEEGLVRPDTLMDVPATREFGGRAFRDEHPGRMTVHEVMARSSNVGTMMVAERLGPERLHDWIRRFGYTRALGLPGENPGLLPPVPDWSATSLPTIAIGHGVSANLLQVAGVYATIARGGEWVAPSLVRGTVGADGRLEPAPAPARERVVSEETAGAVREMLGGVVVDDGGTGALAAVEGYPVAGKTGTARKVTDGSYEAGAYVSTFAGFAPAGAPELVVAVLVDEPREGSYYAGQVAAPIFADVMRFALTHERVAPPDPVEAEAQPSPTPAARDE